MFKRLRFIDVSGLGNSGKSAVVDLLREIDGFYVPEYWFEFDLLRIPGGLIDLRHHLVEDWSPIRSHASIHAFREVIRKMGADPPRWNLRATARCSNQRYDRRFAGHFQRLSWAFAESFVIGSYRAEWPYDSLRDTTTQRFARQVLQRLGFRKQLARSVLMVDGQDFDRRATEYMEALFGQIVPHGTHTVVLNNAFEPFHPKPFLDMLEGSRQIVVLRDPRDIYVSGLNAHNVSQADSQLLAFDNDGMNKSFLATDDIEMFTQRYRLYHKQLDRSNDPRLLQIAFEDFLLNFKESLARIFDFLGVRREQHRAPGHSLVPERSAKNIGIWRGYSRQREIRHIEAQLGEYLFEQDGSLPSARAVAVKLR